jgi:hypothetical protein
MSSNRSTDPVANRAASEVTVMVPDCPRHSHYLTRWLADSVRPRLRSTASPMAASSNRGSSRIAAACPAASGGFGL